MKFRKVSKMVACGHFVKPNALFWVWSSKHEKQSKFKRYDGLTRIDRLGEHSKICFMEETFWKSPKIKGKKQFRTVPKWSFLAILSSLFIVRSNLMVKKRKSLKKWSLLANCQSYSKEKWWKIADFWCEFQGQKLHAK